MKILSTQEITRADGRAHSHKPLYINNAFGKQTAVNPQYPGHIAFISPHYLHTISNTGLPGMRHLDKPALRCVVAIFSMCFAIISHALENPYLDTLNDWSATLDQHVDAQGRTDFVALSKDTRQLQRFVDAISKVSPQSHPELFSSPAQVLAYHINTYNALAMKGVIERDIPKHFNSLIRRASFFKFRKVVIGGKKTNLYDYENKVIRPLGEARLHFALNCMVRDCPRLPQKLFVAETLEQNLQAAAIEFFSTQKHIEIDDAKKIVYLSGIMKFYTKDYVESGKKQDLIAYVNQFRAEPIPTDYKVKFLKYDWTINQQP